MLECGTVILNIAFFLEHIGYQGVRSFRLLSVNSVFADLFSTGTNHFLSCDALEKESNKDDEVSHL